MIGRGSRRRSVARRIFVGIGVLALSLALCELASFLNSPVSSLDPTEPVNDHRLNNDSSETLLVENRCYDLLHVCDYLVDGQLDPGRDMRVGAVADRSAQYRLVGKSGGAA